MGDTQSTIKTLRELNSDLVHQIAELRKKFAESRLRISRLKLRMQRKSRSRICKTRMLSQLKIENQPNEEEAITLNPMPEIEHSSIQSEESKIRGFASSRITFPSIENHSDKKTPIHCETNDSDIYQTICTEPVAEQHHYHGKSLEDIEIDEFLDSEDKKREADSISQNTASTTSRERKNEQGLIREMILSKEEKHVTEISANLVRQNNETSITPSIPAVSQLSPDNRDIISLYKNACDAEIGAIEANREETLRWCFYAREFKSMYKDFMVSNKVGEKNAKGQVYDFIIKQLPVTKRKTLCKQTQKALRIDNLFEKIGIDKIQYIKTYSADTISKFTNSQIQTIIDHFTKKPDIEYTDDKDNSSDDLPEA
ncbi:646_t:CDS:2, partial [Paraglomus occultum]